MTDVASVCLACAVADMTGEDVVLTWMTSDIHRFGRDVRSVTGSTQIVPAVCSAALVIG